MTQPRRPRPALLALVVAAVLYAAVAVAAARLLPGRAPIHFGIDGRADSYTSRTAAVAAFAVLGAAVAAVMAVGGRWVRMMPASFINTRRKDWWLATPEREAELRRRTAGMVWSSGAAVLCGGGDTPGTATRTCRSAVPTTLPLR